MYPNQPEAPRQTDYPVDYLNQIAPTQNKSNLSRPMRILVVVIGIGVVLMLVMLALSLLTSRPNLTERLALRLQETEAITDQAQSQLKSGDLRSANSSLSLILTNTNRDFGEYLSVQGITTKNMDAKIVADEKAESAEHLEQLEEARLNVTYDETYATVMTYRLSTIATYLETERKNSRNQAYQDLLQSTYDNLEPIYQQIADFGKSSD